MANVLWDAVCAALLPTPLRDIGEVLVRFVVHLRRANERRRRPRQRDITRSNLEPKPAAGSARAFAGAA